MSPTQPVRESENSYYPSKIKTGEFHDDFRQLFDHVYALRGQLNEMKGKLAEMERKAAKSGDPEQGSPSNTTINGLFVQAVTPTDGQVLTYKAASGQIEWV